MVGPLTAAPEPHSWDLREKHARPATIPLGWELMRHDASTPTQGDDDLTALAEAVREAGRNATSLALRDEAGNRPQTYRIDSSRHPSARKSVRGHLHVVHDPEGSDS